MNKETMPKTVTITRSYTYDVAEIINLCEIDNPRWEDIEHVINDWVDDDMRSPIHPRELVWTDEEGNEL